LQNKNVLEIGGQNILQIKFYWNTEALIYILAMAVSMVQ
jgi:hypothetical protein